MYRTQTKKFPLRFLVITRDPGARFLTRILGIRNYSVQFHRDGFSEIIYPGGESGGKGRSPLPPGTDRTDPNRTYEDLTRARVRVLLSVRGVVY